jgi:hypothetical protein
MPCKIIARIVGSETNAALSGKTLLAKIVNAENKKPTVFCPFLSALLYARTAN